MPVRMSQMLVERFGWPVPLSRRKPRRIGMTERIDIATGAPS